MTNHFAVPTLVKTPADAVILPRRTYDRLMRDLVRTREKVSRLQAEDDVLTVVREGEIAYRTGRTVIARSSREALRKWQGR